MYAQIARNKRVSMIVFGGFVAAWVLVGIIVGLILSRGGAGGLIAGGIFFAGLGLVIALFGYYFGGGTVLMLAGAQPADPQTYPELHHVVEAIAIGAGLPRKPDVYVVEDEAPNAFATGRDPQHAAVTATTGLLQMMDREELEGVIAHELSHIRNYDVRLLLVVTTLIGFAALVGSWLLNATLWGGGRRDRDSGGITMAIFVAGLLLLLLGYLVGPLMQFALSRQRELLADASGVELTRNPKGLLSALRKLAAVERAPEVINHATAAMWIDNPLEHHAHGFAHLFDTHPPIEERIAALERIAEVRET